MTARALVVNERQAAGLVKLLEHGTLSDRQLALYVGAYATNTIASLEDHGFARSEPLEGSASERVLELTPAGRAIAQYFEITDRRGAR